MCVHVETVYCVVGVAQTVHVRYAPRPFHEWYDNNRLYLSTNIQYENESVFIVSFSAAVGVDAASDDYKLCGTRR